MTESLLSETATAVGIFSGIAVLAWSLCRLVEQALTRRNGLTAAASERMLLRLNHSLEQRLRKQVADLAAAEEALRGRKREHFLLKGRISDARRESTAFTRSLGEEECRNPRNPPKRFTAVVINEVMQRADSSQREHIALSPDWVRPQRIEIWASDAAMARHLLEKSCPPTLGFVIQTFSMTVSAAGMNAAPPRELAS